MQTRRIAAVLVGGLFLAPAAMAQSTNLAYGTAIEPGSERLVFLEKGNILPVSASGAVYTAVSAAKTGRTVQLVGRGDQARVVKQAMIREGAPADAIIVANEFDKPLPKADPLGDTDRRKVEIRF